MNARHMDEAAIDASLDDYLHGAQEGNRYQAQRLHEMLDGMLTEQEMAEGHLWLTDHARMVLAEMRRQLSHCEGEGHLLSDRVMEAVQLKPRKSVWQDACSYVKDLRVAISVANELCEQKGSGQSPDIAAAAQIVADRGEFDLDSSQIRTIYEEVAATTGGFDPIESFNRQCRLAEDMMLERIVPNFVQPLTETIAQKRLS